jgi:NAD(P)H-hydrate epimerase
MAEPFEAVYTAAEMRAAEERYPNYPDSIPELMERAGSAVAREAMLAYPAARRFACVCGGGSNGGDGRVAARVLREAGLEADEVVEHGSLDGYDVIVDALFGTGFRDTPRPEAAALIEEVNASPAAVVSVDVASGVDASTGEIAGKAVTADLTVTFHAPKVGLIVAPGRFHAGRVVVADICLADLPTNVRRVTPAVLAAMPRRGTRDTKYTAGSVLVVGGQPGMTGAACLAALAALRADAGYVTLAVPEDALAAAEGLGRSLQRQALVRDVLERVDLPAVIDADALFELEPIARSAATVLTPHAGELGRLLGKDARWVDAHRLAAAHEAAERFGAVVLLKGADTIVASSDGTAIVSDLAPPSLATAGTGDVLTGILAAFLSKAVEPATAAAAAAVAHALAARSVAHQSGLLASDLLETLPAALEA